MIAPITEDEARSVVNVVCWRLGVPAPLVSWSKRAKNGRYNVPLATRVKAPTIAAGPLMWRGALVGLLHEIAHHVAVERVKARGLKHAGLGGVRPNHGPQFVRALKDVAQLWYGDYAAYPWETEYRSLRAAGRRENR